VKLGYFLLLVGIAATSTAGPTAVVREAPRLIDFEMQDQFRQIHRDDDHAGRILVIIGSDQDGSRFNSGWGGAIDGSLEGQGDLDLDYLPVADLRGVPFFVKGFVRKKFPREKLEWVLMDWHGHFARSYQWLPGRSNILIFARDGALVQQSSGTMVEDDGLRAITETLRRLLAAD
jgi:hypothetical protein